jgi:hypothetical protein
MKKELNPCPGSKKKGFLMGILYGLLPHAGCFLVISLPLLGLTTVSAFLIPLLVNSYFLYILIFFSVICTTISALLYLRRRNALSIKGAKENFRYIAILYGTVLIVNLLVFKLAFPFFANIYAFSSQENNVLGERVELTENLKLEVNLPCSGHAFLVTGQLRNLEGVSNVVYVYPDIFEVVYLFEEISPSEIMEIEIFSEFEAKIVI